MCSGAKPIPWSHLQHCMLMAQQSLARQRPPVFLTILFQEEMIAAWFTPSSHRLMCTFVIPDVYFLDVFSSFLPNSLPCLHHSTYFPSKIKTLHPLCDQILSLFFFFSALLSRLRHYPESALPSQPVHGQLPIGGDRAVPAQEEAAHPQPADPAQPQRAVRGREGPGHQDPAQEMQLPQEQRVSARPHDKSDTINLSVKSKYAQQSFKVTSFYKMLFFFYLRAPGLAVCRGR